jgi:hypothetical protein
MHALVAGACTRRIALASAGTKATSLAAVRSVTLLDADPPHEHAH